MKYIGSYSDNQDIATKANVDAAVAEGVADYLPLKGGTCTGGVTAPNFQTGDSDDAYFQTKKMRGQGNASTYKHAVDWGYSGHNQVDFYEYGSTWNFWECKNALSDAVLVGSVKNTGWNGGAVLSGTPTAPTAESGTNTTQIATTAFVQSATSTHNTDTSAHSDIREAIDGKQATITGAATTITSNNLTASRALVSNSSGKVAASDVTATELSYLDGVTSNIQTQLNKKLESAPVTSVNNKTGAVTLSASDVGALPDTTVIPTVNNATLTIQKNGSTVKTFTANASSDVTANITVPTTVAELSDASSYATTTQLDAKQDTITGGATTITSNNLTASRALVSDSSGKVAVSAVTSAELGYLEGATSNIQTQINSYAAHATLVTLTVAGWDATAKTQTVTVSGILADESKQLIIPMPATASMTAYTEAGIQCTGQAANSLTFTATTVPTAALSVYVTYQSVM